MTNFEKIKGMNKAELAEFLFNIRRACAYGECESCIMRDNDYCDQAGIREYLSRGAEE